MWGKRFKEGQQSIDLWSINPWCPQTAASVLKWSFHPCPFVDLGGSLKSEPEPCPYIFIAKKHTKIKCPLLIGWFTHSDRPGSILTLAGRVL